MNMVGLSFRNFSSLFSISCSLCVYFEILIFMRDRCDEGSFHSFASLVPFIDFPGDNFNEKSETEGIASGKIKMNFQQLSKKPQNIISNYFLYEIIL